MYDTPELPKWHWDAGGPQPAQALCSWEESQCGTKSVPKKVNQPGKCPGYELRSGDRWSDEAYVITHAHIHTHTHAHTCTHIHTHTVMPKWNHTQTTSVHSHLQLHSSGHQSGHCFCRLAHSKGRSARLLDMRRDEGLKERPHSFLPCRYHPCARKSWRGCHPGCPCDRIQWRWWHTQLGYWREHESRGWALRRVQCTGWWRNCYRVI